MFSSKENSKPASKKVNNSGVFFQPKLVVNQPNDRYEQEADAMADRVMRMTIQRKCAACELEEKLQRKPLTGSAGGTFVPGHVEAGINQSMRGGSHLDGGTKSLMENSFGADFSNVTIHTGPDAVQLSNSLRAQAFTVGNDIFFNEGKYNPNSMKGKQLLAHELTHTLQQSGGIGRRVQKYSHEDCDEISDLRPHIWPANHIATSMVNSAIAALTASPITAATNGYLDKHFNDHSATTIASVLAVFRRIQAAFTANDYTYECEDDCDSENAYVYGIWSDIHLCMNQLRGRDNKGIAAIIVHEFSHYYGGTDDNVYFFSFGAGSAPASLSVSDAVENADSYEGFAYDIL